MAGAFREASSLLAYEVRYEDFLFTQYGLVPVDGHLPPAALET